MIDPEFIKLRDRARVAYQQYIRGEIDLEDWRVHAQAACNYYNEKATEVAKKYGIKPKLIRVNSFKK